MEGNSFAHTFSEGSAPSSRTTQYFKMFGHRSIYHDGWRAVCPWPGTSFAEGKPFGTPIMSDDLRELDAHGWELYRVADDPTEKYDVAAEHPEVLRELISLWYVEAGRYNVLPLDGRGQQRFADERPQLTRDRVSYVYYPGTQQVPTNSAVKVINRPHSITAEVEVPEGGAEGVVISHGGNDGGYVLYVENNRLCYAHNYVATRYLHVRSEKELPPGPVELRYEFEPTGEPDTRARKGSPGRGQIYVAGELIAQEDFPVTIPIMLGLGGGVSVGHDEGSPVLPRYDPPFEFTGTIKRVIVDVSGDLIEDDEAAMRVAMARQ